MDLNELINNYQNYTVVGVDNNDIESFFKDSNETAIKKNSDREYSLRNSKFFTGYRIPLNTSVFADALITRVDNGDSDFFPELALMFLKTYSKELLTNQDKFIDPKTLVSVFNKNQELIEIPYPIVLLLGGLYYFQENQPLIGDLSTDKLFKRINGISYKPFDPSRDIYDHPDLYRTPATYRTNSTGDKEFLTFPSVRVLNRSLYELDKQTFKIKTRANDGSEVTENVTINTKSIMPSVGYGIQNKFLNYYNKTLFGEYLNGTKTDEAPNLPNVLSGGYSGILKPIKTYNSNQFEFTAFYRNNFVGNYSYDIKILVSDLDEATKNLKRRDSIATSKLKDYILKLNISYIKAFLVYSKLKANFLSGTYSTKDHLKENIKLLCEKTNITSKYNDDLPTDREKLCDFYFLVSHVFFTSFHRVIPGSSNEQPFELEYRLVYGSNDTELYQKSAIGDDLHNILNIKNKTKSEQIDSLTEFLYKIWSLEKNNLNKNYRINSSNGTFSIFPSAGGFITPNDLLINSESPTEYTLSLKQTNTIEGHIRGEGSKPVIKNKLYDLGNNYNVDDYGLAGLNLTRSGKMVDPLDFASANTLFNQLPQNQDIDNPKTPKFLLEKNLDRYTFLVNYCFNNHSILNNTTRFFWFENNNLGQDLKLDYSFILQGYYEKDNGLKDAFNYKESNLNYLKNTSLSLFEHENFSNMRDISYNSMYDFNRLMDSINVEKLIDFSKEFEKFSKISINQDEGKFNLNSLIKSSTIITDKDFTDINVKGDFNLTGTDISLALIGNSMFNYEFISKCDLSKYLNISLSSAQKTRCEHVANEFNSQILTIANKSAIDSVTKIGDFQLSIHNFHSSPEVLFTNTKTYEELKTALKGDSIDDVTFNKLIARRILFGEQYVPAYSSFTDNQKEEIKTLNKSYLYSEIHHPIYQNGGDIKIKYNNYYLSVVESFFKYINIRYTKENYKQLIKLIRGYSYLVSSDIKILNTEYLPNSGLIDFTEYSNKIQTGSSSTRRVFTVYNQQNQNDNTRITIPIGPTLPPQADEEPKVEEYAIQADLNILVDKFFSDFNKKTFESIVSGLNGFLSKLYDNIAPLSRSQSSVEESQKESVVNEFKKTTYYNIKSLFDKVSTAGLQKSADGQTTGSVKTGRVEDINSLDINEVIYGNKLFYNYSIDPNFCYGDDPIKNTTYDLYQIFQVIDRGNNDIGSKALADLVYLYDNLYSDFDNTPNAGQSSDVLTLKKLTNASMQNLFSGLAKSSGFLFQQIPNYLNINGYLGRAKDGETIYDLVDELFGVHTDTSLLGENRGTTFGGLTGFPGYIFQLGTLSSKLSAADRTSAISKNDNLSSFCLDVGYDNNGEVSVKTEDAPEEILKSNITCFTVDFGVQNQQMFNSIQLDTSEFYDTEESIRAWVDVVNNTQLTVQTSNIFPILEKRSYSCTVTSLGNATIQPLSYFYLRNVPLFYGTYWITNVSHDIKPNTMLTTFKGVRQPISTKNDIRKQLLYLIRERAKIIKEGNQKANIIQTESVPDTNGDVLLLPTNLQNPTDNNPYGYVLQKTNNGTYYKFDGLEIIAKFVVSITNRDDDNPSNIGLIHTLYNQSSAFIDNSVSHNEIVKNMKNIAIGIMNERVKMGDTRYSDTQFKNVILSKLMKENNVSTTGGLYVLLNDLAKSFEQYSNNERLKLKNSEKIFNFTVPNGAQIQNQNSPVSFLMDTEINTISANSIPINTATFYFEETDKISKLNTVVDGISSITENDLDYADINTVFNTKNWSLNELNIPFNITKNNAVNSIKYLGAYAPGKVAFFSGNFDNGSYGKIKWSARIKEKYKLKDATNEDVANEFIQPSLGSEERSAFIIELTRNAKLEYDKWNVNDTQLKDTEYGTNRVVTTALDNYWKSATGNNYVNNQPWSATFISHIIKISNPSPNDFKYSTKHAEYIVDARDNNKSWKAYSAKDTSIQLGDLICYARNGRNEIGIELKDFTASQDAHCDCVTTIVGSNSKSALIIGGNLSNSVSQNTINLNTNGIVNDKKRTVILRFDPNQEVSVQPQITLSSSNISKSKDVLQQGSVQTSLDETIQFLTEVLIGIGISTPNASQIQFMKNWRQHEGGRAAWNPFNTTQVEPNSTLNTSTAKVRNYADRQSGINATIKTLTNGKYNNVIQAIKNIKQDSDIDNAMIAVNNSPWGSDFKPTNHKYWKTLNNLIWKPPLV